MHGWWQDDAGRWRQDRPRRGAGSEVAGVLAFVAAVAGAVCGVSAPVVDPDTGAWLIAASVLCAALAAAGGLAAWLWSRSARRREGVALGGTMLGAATLGVWLVAVAIALGK